MTPLINTIMSNGADALEATIVAAAAAVIVTGIVAAEKPSKTEKQVRVDARTMADIGIEPGSITWMR